MDIVATFTENHHTDILFAECVFTKWRCGIDELQDLIYRGYMIKEGQTNRHLLPFSRSGFTDGPRGFVEGHPGLRVDLVGMDGIVSWAEDG